MSDQYFGPTTGVPGAPVFELSGWWRRVGALLIDTLILAIPIVILVGIFAVALAGSSPDSSDDLGIGGGLFLGIVVVGILLPALYYCWIMPRTNGQTVGKKALEIRVVREDGQAITAGFAFNRQILVISLLFNLLGSIFLFNLPLLIDYLWPLWDSKNQALHDKIVKSRVVRATQTIALPPGPPIFPVGTPTAPPPTATPVPYVPPDQRYVAPQPPAAPPPSPQPGGTSTPYTPPPSFENPVPEDD